MDNRPDIAFLTITAWPENSSRDDRAEWLAEVPGLDLLTLRMRTHLEPPVILTQLSDDQAKQATFIIHSQGGEAFAPTLRRIESLGETIKVKDMELVNDGYSITPWRGNPLYINSCDIDVIIRARISETSVSRVNPTLMQSPPGSGAAVYFGAAGGGAFGAALAFSGMYAASPSSPERKLTISNKLDFHTADGRVFQIDGDKFGFNILGDSKGLSDNTNVDAMCNLMTHFSPGAVIDPYFSLWSPPVAFKRMRIPGMLVNNDDPSFAFYSRWATLMYRYILTGN